MRQKLLLLALFVIGSASLGCDGPGVTAQATVAVALPLLGGDCVTRLMVYLHRIRLEAQLDGIRSPWLNQKVVSTHPDIVFITRRLGAKPRPLGAPPRPLAAPPSARLRPVSDAQLAELAQEIRQELKEDFVTDYDVGVDDIAPVSHAAEDVRLTCEVEDGTWAGNVPASG